MATDNLNRFIGLYPVSKTLRFELRPVGKTAENFSNSGLLKDDVHRAASYKKAKKIIDEYHKEFINSSLLYAKLDEKSLVACYDLLISRNYDKDELSKAQKKLREDISSCFDTKQLFSKDLIQKLLPDYLSDDSEKSIVNEFKNYTTYFTGFNQNRENIYTSDPIGTSIAFRLINENLPKFISNFHSFELFKQSCPEALDMLASDNKEIIDAIGLDVDSIFSDVMSYNRLLDQKNITRYNELIGGRSEGNIK